jgi:peptidoglycan hydrolase-like protein with peptidoglycan-binding domain
MALQLKAFRFRYDPVLEACLNGSYRLLVTNPQGPFEMGRHIRKIQQALVDLNISLSVHGIDSTYGPETENAVLEFKRQRDIRSPDGTIDGIVGVKTMTELDAIFADELPFPIPPSAPGDLWLDDFIEAIQGAESDCSLDSTPEFVTRIRQLYYPGTDPDGLTIREFAFDHLLPDAPIRSPDGNRRILTPTITDPIFFSRLSQRAPENPTPGKPLDNPSPYLLDTTGQRVDLGHVFLTIDALLHPQAGSTYQTFGVPAIDPASWVADLGIGSVWAEQDGQPDAPSVLPRLPNGDVDFEGYYRMSAPDADLLGDMDGFNIVKSWLAGQSLSSVLIAYYVDGDTHPGLYRQRFRMFLNSLFGTSTPDASALSNGVSFWEPRVNRFNDMFAAGAIGAFFTLTPPPPKSWKFTSDAIANFFQWLMDQQF